MISILILHAPPVLFDVCQQLYLPSNIKAGDATVSSVIDSVRAEKKPWTRTMQELRLGQYFTRSLGS